MRPWKPIPRTPFGNVMRACLDLAEADSEVDAEYDAAVERLKAACANHLVHTDGRGGLVVNPEFRALLERAGVRPSASLPRSWRVRAA